MELERDGGQLFPGVLGEAALGKAIADVPKDRPGLRIHRIAELSPLLAPDGTVGRIAAGFLSASARPVRAILFDKSEATNWALGWHQDRTIAVVERIDVAGFGPWSVKGGIPHVEPPIEILQSMITLRVHLDPVDEDNAPLLVAPGSHRVGRIPENRIDAIVGECGRYACLAKRGDIWAYSTLILHTSEAARRPRRRRVLQVDYSIADLPGGLQFCTF
jgi:hypothetical protein